MNDANKNMNNRQREQPIFHHFFEKIEIKRLPALLNCTGKSSSTDMPQSLVEHSPQCFTIIAV